MPWTSADHRTAVRFIETELRARDDADLDGRVIESMATENAGNRLVPRGTLTGGRLDRALGSGRYDRWTTLVWRCRLAARLARAEARRSAAATDDPLGALEDAGLIDRAEAQRRADALRDGTAAPLTGNRAARRAARRRPKGDR